jgi:phosphatidylinositol-3-phosphatase
MTKLHRHGIAVLATGALTLSAAPPAAASVIQHVFVITMENHDASQIYGNTTSAPYINNTLLSNYAHATNWNDELPSLASEPHYIWMEAGTNAFSDHTFTTDNDPSTSNSTASTAHLTTQIKNSTNVTWITYQEGQNGTTGACPVASSGFYAAKHNPFVFFKDVSGNKPSKTNAYCSAHSKPYSSFATDLAANNMADYVFITPNLCNDMHGASGCPNSNTIKSGDDWLQAELPRIIDWATTHSAVIFITWDEGSSTNQMPFLAIGPGVKANYAGAVSYTHSSIIKSVEEIFGLPILSTVSGSNDLSDLFEPGFFP